MADKLTGGAIHTIMSGGKVDRPVVQMINYRRIVNNNQERYRLLISDGQHIHSFAMLATQLNHMISDNILESNAVIQLDRFVCNVVKSTGDQQNKRVVIILELTVVMPGKEVGMKLGNPVVHGDDKSQSTGVVNHPPPQNNNTIQRPVSTPVNNNAIQRTVSAHAVPANFFPISSLTPYQNKWTIRARITNKSDVRFWSNSRGEGKLFSVEMLDESGEIRATAFKEQCDKFYDMMEVGKVYYISRGTLKTANKQFTSVKNEYEMTFNSDTTVILCNEDSDIPSLQFNFVPICDLTKLDKDSVIDVIGVCKRVGDLQTVIARSTRKELKKRDLGLVDASNTEVQLTLWGSQAETFEGENYPVVAVKGARTSDFGGVSLSLLHSSTMQINPDIDETFRLKGWFENEGKQQDTNNISNQHGGGMSGATYFRCLADAKLENLGAGEKADYYSCVATVIQFRADNALYQACPQESCNKKVVDQNNGMYRCEKCNQEFPNFKWRLLLSADIADSTDHQWVTCFQESAETMISCSAEELGRLKDEDTDAYQMLFKNASFCTWAFRLRIKMENYNGESRLQHVVASVTPVDLNGHCERLRHQIREMGGQA